MLQSATAVEALSVSVLFETKRLIEKLFDQERAGDTEGNWPIRRATVAGESKAFNDGDEVEEEKLYTDGL